VITEAIIKVFAGMASFLIGLLPSWTPPSWLADVTTTMGDAIGYIGMLNGWVPVSAIGTVCGFILAAGAIAWGIKIARMVLSVATGGGGSAA